MFLDVCLEILVAFIHLVDGSVIKFIQFRLVVLLLVEINLELLDLVFPGRFSRVVVLRECENEVRIFLDHFRHLDGFGVLFACERFCVCIDYHFIVFAEVKAESVGACHGKVPNESERRDGDLHE